MNTGQAAAAAPDWRPKGLDDHDIAHRQSVRAADDDRPAARRGASGKTGLVPDMFVPLLQPPDTPAISASLWFHVRGSNVLVTESPLAGLSNGAEPLFVGMLETTACWAVEVPAGLEAPDEGPFTELRALFGRVPEVQWIVAGRAVQLVDWARTHRYCGRCGTATALAVGERAMRCPACGLLAFPRIAPAIITLVSRGDEVLLARGVAFPVPMYSCIAGFVEPGETLEEAVRREVREEVGVEITNIRYEASQPWPFPHSLMVGFTADWAGGDIVVDEREIVDAQWFRADTMPAIPPGISIARKLIDGWLHTVAGR
jgi:NAD+ diphosphatase